MLDACFIPTVGIMSWVIQERMRVHSMKTKMDNEQVEAGTIDVTFNHVLRRFIYFIRFLM